MADVTRPARRRPDNPPSLQLPIQGDVTRQATSSAPADRAEVQRVLDLALGVGAVLVASGVGAVDATASMAGVTEAYGLRRCQFDVTFTRITISYRRGIGEDPLTAMHQVRARSLDYTRLDAADRLVQRIVAGEIVRDDAQAELDRLVRAAHPYPRWVATVALAAMAAGLATLFNGGVLVVAVAALTTAAVDRVGRFLNSRGVLLFFQQVLGAAVATAATLTLKAVGLAPETNPSVVVAASIVVLLSGLSVVGSVQDALTGYYLTAVARGVEIALFSIALFAGVTIALQTGLLLDINVDVNPEYVDTPAMIPIQVVAGAIAAAAFAVASYAPWRAAAAAGGGGVASSTVFLLLTYFDFDPVVAAFGAATLVGLVGAVLSRRLKLPPLVFGMAGIIPLVPGLATYRGFVELANENLLGAYSSLTVALGTALALAAGVLLGHALAQPVRQRLSRLERRFRGPRLAGPRPGG
ncbi:MAG: threonine/serine exporter family protein [Pseudonocardiaceae bacterium]|nr:threonine/serine exporter family protein [Pseudonocardiaceae bacterium]